MKITKYLWSLTLISSVALADGGHGNGKPPGGGAKQTAPQKASKSSKAVGGGTGVGIRAESSEQAEQ